MSSPSQSKAIHTLVKRGWISLAQFGALANRTYPAIHKAQKRGEVPTVIVNGIHRIYTGSVLSLLSDGRYKNQDMHDLIVTYLKRHGITVNDPEDI